MTTDWVWAGKWKVVIYPVTPSYGDLLAMYEYQTPTYWNRTAQASNDTINDTNIFPTPAENDAAYFASSQKVSGLKIKLDTVRTGGGMVWEYYNGSAWVTAPVIDGTNQFTKTGINYVTWSAVASPLDWATVNVNSYTAYWIRARCIAGVSYSGAVYASRIWSSTERYYDNSSGVISGISVTVSNDGTGKFKISFDNSAGSFNSIFSAGDQVVIFLDKTTSGSTARLLGRVKNVSHSRNGELNTLVLEGFGYLDALQNTIVSEVYTGIRTLGSIITDATDGLLAKYAPDITDSGVETTGKSLASGETLIFDFVTFREALQRLADLVGDWIFEITPSKVLNFRPRGNVDNSKVIEDFDNVDFKYVDTNLINRLILIGSVKYSQIPRLLWTGTGTPNYEYYDQSFAYDGNSSTEWNSLTAQSAAQSYKLDLGALVNIAKIFITSGTYYPKGYKLTASIDDVNYDDIYWTYNNLSSTIIQEFLTGKPYRYINIELIQIIGETVYWTIQDIAVYTQGRVGHVAKDTASITEHGEYQSVVRDQSLSSLQQLVNRGNADLVKYAEPYIEGQVLLNYFFDCVPNELVTLNIPGTPINQKFSVESVTFTEAGYGTFKTDITLRSV